MDKLIPLNKGIHRQPSVGTDGELSELVNLIPQNGELVNVRGLEKSDSPEIQGTLIAVHKVDEGLNYIYYLSENRLKSITYNKTELDIGPLSGYKDVGIIGNTVCISTSTGMKYALWRGEKYILFTQENLTYKFNVEYADTRRFQGEHVTVDLSLKGADRNRAIFRAADTKVNEIISERTDPSRWFNRITLGMAALKLYDGSYITYSNIFTLDPPSPYHGLGVSVDYDSTENNVEVAGSLMAYNITVSLTENYALIKDLVSSVDIFLSHSTGFFDLDSSDNIVRTYFPKKGYEDIIKEIDGMKFFKSLSFNIDEFNAGNNVTKPARRVTGAEQSLDLSGIQGAFYTGECAFPYNGRLTLGNVVSRMRSVDSPDMNQKAVGGKIITNVPNIDNESSTNRASGHFLGYYDVLADYMNEADVVIEVDIAGGDGGNMRTYRYNGTMQYPFPPIISYPDANANDMRIYVGSPRNRKPIYALATIKLSPLSMSNMAIAVNVIENETEQLSHLSYLQPYKMEWVTAGYTEYIDPIENGLMPPNSAIEWKALTYDKFEEIIKLKGINPESRNGNAFVYSPYGNPFSLNTISNIRIGNGEIKGVSTSVKALSQGQFGQFPLYVFCSDGVYALEVASDGSFSATNPISRDVCNNPDSITQIDGAVVFTTDQGLMMLQGSEVVNLSGAMEGFNVNESDYFKPADGTPFFESYGKAEFDQLVIEETRDFRDILKSCKIAYDYVNKMLRIFPTGDNFRGKYYVYSLESGEYATVYQEEGITTVVPDYPSSIVQIGKSLYRPAERDDNDNTKKGLLLTRPIMLDEPFALKKLQDMRLHYSKHYEDSKCNVIVYVSNDGNRWMQLKSLRRKAYKYYRFAIITDMKDMDALSGMVLRYEVERKNKLR